jgi:hypothetical protein
MEAVADLMAVSAEADVFQWPATKVTVYPIRKNALIGASELTGAGEYAATVDEDRELEGFTVFQREGFGREFGRSVE